MFRSDLVRPGGHDSVKMPDLLIPTSAATPVTIGTDVYLAGGNTPTVETAKLVQVYDIQSGNCRKLQQPSLQYYSEAVAIEGSLVLIGGKSSSTDKPTDMVSTWMAGEEQWTRALPPMKMKRHKPGVLLLKTHLFVFGGLDEDEKILNCFEVLDLSTKQWSTGTGSLPDIMSSPKLGVFGKYAMLYDGVLLGGSRVCYTVSVEVLVDSATSQVGMHWTRATGVPLFESALLTTSRDPVFIGGYDKAHGQVSGAIRRLLGGKPAEDIGELSQPRSLPSVVAVNDRSFLVLGGYSTDSTQSLLTSVEHISYR